MLSAFLIVEIYTLELLEGNCSSSALPCRQQHFAQSCWQ